MDRGFIDYDNFDTMDTGGIYFITPMKRNSWIMDYSCEMKDFFMFRNRAIRDSVKKTGKYDLHLFEDLLMKAYRENDYYARISEGKRIDFLPERAGKIAILNNAGEKSQKVFELYKFRNDVEESIDAFKNLLRTDTPYLRDDDTLRGYLFVSFISLIAYYRILSLLKKKGINDRISVKDVVLQLSKIHLTDVGNRSILAEIPKKARELAELLGMEPDLFPESVLS
ncbi:transposase [Cuniculiplasma sp. SKW3]|uniref:transposase n=1 Tax=Cuniculiplasma sp. SKW3 TaxID=3400170 RepID=UPI003FCFC9D5